MLVSSTIFFSFSIQILQLNFKSCGEKLYNLTIYIITVDEKNDTETLGTKMLFSRHL